MLKNLVAEAPDPCIHDLMLFLDRDKSETVQYAVGMKAFTWRVPRVLVAMRIGDGQVTSRSNRYLFSTSHILRRILALNGDVEANLISHSLGGELENP
jgi:hypothetical protein